MAYLLSCRKRVVSPLPRYRNAPVKTRGLNKWVIWGVTSNTDLFVLYLGISSIYIPTSTYLQLQANRECISCPVEGEFGEPWPRSSDRGSHDHYRILEFWAAK